MDRYHALSSIPSPIIGYTETMTGFERYLPFIFPIFFISLWTLILGIFSYISGWRRLAERFHQPGDFQGEFLRYQSARMNLVNYNGVLNLGLSPAGLYLVPMVLFRTFHKPILIPWENIVAEPFKRVLYRGYQLQFRSVPGVRLDLYQHTFERLIGYLQAFPDRLQIDRNISYQQ